ncbi:hypothetical protein LY76DRAFT_272088 [Colletotrichum caudatum]|nr:hypothetical protein LY76DRAFT_272088 [Colletotrichum caudatum]
MKPLPSPGLGLSHRPLPGHLCSVTETKLRASTSHVGSSKSPKADKLCCSDRLGPGLPHFSPWPVPCTVYQHCMRKSSTQHTVRICPYSPSRCRLIVAFRGHDHVATDSLLKPVERSSWLGTDTRKGNGKPVGRQRPPVPNPALIGVVSSIAIVHIRALAHKLSRFPQGRHRTIPFRFTLRFALLCRQDLSHLAYPSKYAPVSRFCIPPSHLA